MTATEGSTLGCPEQEGQTGQTLNLYWILVTQFGPVIKTFGNCADAVNNAIKPRKLQPQKTTQHNLNH